MTISSLFLDKSTALLGVYGESPLIIILEAVVLQNEASSTEKSLWSEN